MWKVDKGSLTGITTAAYASALDWSVEEMREKTIVLKNTHASASLKYKLLVYAAAAGIAGEEVSETTLAAGETSKIPLSRQWARLL